MKKNFLPGVLFAALLITGLAAFILLPTREYSVREKRFLAVSPDIDARTLKEAAVSQKMEEYLSDQFPLRDTFVAVSAYFDLLCGKNTAQDFVKGQDGRLFAAPAAYDRTRLASNLSAAEKFVAETGLDTYLAVVPESGYIYREALPANAAPYEDAELLEQITSSLKTVVPVPLEDALADAHEEEELYYKTDHHLTSAGSYLVYRKLCSVLGLTPFEREDFTVESYEGFCGTAWSGSGYWLADADSIELWRWDGDEKVEVTVDADETAHEGFFFTEHLDDEDKYPVYLGGNHALTHLHNDGAQEGTLLIVKDSFAHCISGFLSRHYRDIYLVDMRYYKEPVSELAEKTGAEKALVLYGLANLSTDSGLSWLR